MTPRFDTIRVRPIKYSGRGTLMLKSSGRPKAAVIPPLIKRNIALFALSQSFTGAGMSFAFGLGPLMVIALTGSATMTGLSVGLIGLSRFLISYPIGKITDTYGRKPGILFGLVLALVGAVMVGLSVRLHSFALLFVGMLVFGMGMNATQQLRVAATDMFPPHMRAQALGYIALGSMVSLLLSPLVISAAEAVAPGLGQDPLGLPWLLLPVLIVSGMILISFVHPDPKEIGMHLERYYPDFIPLPLPPEGQRSSFSARTMLRILPIRLAIISNCAAQGNMSIVMVLTSLVLKHHGYSLGAIAFSHMFHSAGMFGFTIPLGKLADRFGRGQVMFPGVATALAGAALVAFTEKFLTVTVGTFLVGLGWAAANVAATAMIADHAETAQRGRAIGVNESFAGATSVLIALVTGPLIQGFGLAAAGWVAVLVAMPPLLITLVVKVRDHLAGRAAGAGIAGTP
ncbi:MAG: MFS transporter [Desulfobacterales bacterium]|nr:MFS transporter [Desulfobacterales bacterium]